MPDYRELHKTALAFLSLTINIRRDLLTRPGAPKLKFSCPEELVVVEGTVTYAEIERCKFPPMQIGNCFANAMRLTVENPELTYVEGWAMMEQSIPTHHAWVMHPDGSISDPTWLSMCHDIRAGRQGRMIPGWNGRCVYMGIPVPREYHFGWTLTHDTMNLLCYGDMTRKEVLENGYDAFLQFGLLRSEMQQAGEQIMEMIGAAPAWELADDRSHYIKRDRSGEITERWYGENTDVSREIVTALQRGAA